MASLPKRTYTTAFEGARALGRLLAPDDLKWEIELPLRGRQAPLILHISCNAHATLFVAYIAKKVLEKLGLDFIIMGGPENCCGSIHKNLGDGDLQEEVATKALLGFNRGKPQTVLSICPDCDDVFSLYPLKGQSFRHSNIAELFVEHLDALKPYMHPVNKRVIFHAHDVSPARVRDCSNALAVLNAIPGLELLPAKKSAGPGIHCQTVHPMPPDDQAAMFEEARALGADALIVPYHSCYRQHVKMQLKYGVETHHFFSLLAMSLGIEFEEHFKQLRLLDDMDSVMETLKPRILAAGYQPDDVQPFLQRAIFC